MEPTPNNCVSAQRLRAETRRAAFTIVEMIVVLMIMGIVAAAAAPTFYRSVQYHRLESAARRVKLDLEQARHTARMKSQAQSLTFATAASTAYTLSAGARGLKSTGQTYAVDLASTPYELSGVAVNFGGLTSVAFDGYGTASVGGTIVLTLGAQTRTVTLNQANGAISISNP